MTETAVGNELRGRIAELNSNLAEAEGEIGELKEKIEELGSHQLEYGIRLADGRMFSVTFPTHAAAISAALGFAPPRPLVVQRYVTEWEV